MVTLIKRKVGVKTWLYLDVKYKGQRKKKALHLCLYQGKTSENKKTLELAEKIRQKTELELISGSYGIIEKEYEFYQYFELQAMQNPSYTRRTGVLKHLRKFAPELTFKTITPQLWDDFKNYLVTEKRFKKNTIKTTFSILKAVLNKAVRDGIILNNPLEKISEKAAKIIKEFLTLDEIKKLDQTPCKNETFKKAFLFSCFTGLRLSDIINLKYQDISGDMVKATQIKTKEPVYIPLAEQAKKYIPNKGKTENVFPIPPKGSTYVILREWVALAGISRHITFHSARHTFATLSITYGIDITTLSKLMGHTDVKTTMVYAKVIDERKKQAIDLLPVWD